MSGLQVKVAERGELPDRYKVFSESSILSCEISSYENDFEYIVSWSIDAENDVKEMLSGMEEVAESGRIDPEEIYGDDLFDEDESMPDVFSYFLDSDGERWEGDFWRSFVDVHVPSEQKITDDVLVNIYSETAQIEEATAHQMLEALQSEVP